MIEEVEKYVKEKHKNQERKNGTPYYIHPFSVRDIIKQKGYNENYQLVALLHDILEDTDGTKEEILNLTNDKVLEAVILLTKEKNYNTDDYINRIKNNSLALPVKLADRLHNLVELMYTDLNFRNKYIKETEEYYISLATGTVFEHDILNALNLLKEFDKKISD